MTRAEVLERASEASAMKVLVAGKYMVGDGVVGMKTAEVNEVEEKRRESVAALLLYQIIVVFCDQSFALASASSIAVLELVSA